MGANLRVAVIDDHELLRVGVTRAIVAVPRWEVAHSVGSVDEFLALDSGDIDVVVLDLVTPGRIEGFDAIDVLTRLGLDVVVLTALDVADVAPEATRRGAVAVVGKGEGPARLLEAIAAATGVPASNGPLLTPREREVLMAIRDGLRNQEIATRLSISLSAVKRHLEHIMEKTEVRTRNGVAALPIDTL